MAWTNTANRNAMIGKIHVAKKQLAMTDDSYRAMLKRLTGKDSSKALSLAQLHDVLTEFERFGFKGTGGKRSGSRPKADTAQASMIRALWLDLYHLGEAQDPSEEAIARFAGRTCKGLRALQWMNTTQADAIIRALRGWLQRIGFTAPLGYQVDGLAILRRKSMIDDFGHPLQGIAWKVAIIHYQMKMLSIEITDDNTPVLIEAENLDAAIEAYGRSVRAMKAARAQ